MYYIAVFLQLQAFYLMISSHFKRTDKRYKKEYLGFFLRVILFSILKKIEIFMKLNVIEDSKGDLK